MSVSLIMYYEEIEPFSTLQPFIDCYWVLKNTESDIVCNKILPDGCVDIIFNFGQTCSLENGARLENGKVYLVGAMTSYKVSYIFPDANLVGIRFRPLGFSRFFSYCSLHEINDEIIEFEQKAVPEFSKVLKHSSSYLDKYLLSKITSKVTVDWVRPIISDIEAHSGKVKIEDLAMRYDISVRRLERRFKKDVGLSPKEFIDTIRNRSAVQALRQRNERATLLEIALDHGYYDHSHLCKEIKKFSGDAPSFL